MDLYPAKYTDVYGSENIVITNDGKTLCAVIRGVEFAGIDFDSLEPPSAATPEQLRMFVLHHSMLCRCRIECQIPMPINNFERIDSGTLDVSILLGKPGGNSGLDREELSITLQYQDRSFSGSGKSGWFEDELNDIQRQLSDGIFMMACINCLYSDYSPFGNGTFGYMMCFRNLKQEYLQVTNKAEFWDVHDRFDRFVQETYLCPEFQKRVPGTGYRC
jgi:Family of unknown function (DUF6304)